MCKTSRVCNLTHQDIRRETPPLSSNGGGTGAAFVLGATYWAGASLAQIVLQTSAGVPFVLVAFTFVAVRLLSRNAHMQCRVSIRPLSAPFDH